MHSVSKEVSIGHLWLWESLFFSAGNGHDIAEELLHSCAPAVLWSSCNCYVLTCFISPPSPLMYFQLITKILATGSEEHNLTTLGYWSSCCIIALISLNNPVLILVPKIITKNVNKLSHRTSQVSPVSEWAIAVSTYCLCPSFSRSAIPQHPKPSNSKSVFLILLF